MNLFWLLIVLLALGGAQSFVFSRFNFKSLKYTRTFSKRSVYEGETVEMVAEVFCKDKELEFSDRLRAVPGVADVTLIQYNGEYHG